MYSAGGTKLNDKLRKYNDLEESDIIENNNKYVINDLLVRKIYNSLKLWYKSYSEIYGMTIDSLTTPKITLETSKEDFYQFKKE